jgi:hypothetical protein
MKLTLYHRTSAAVAGTILREGFRDGVGTYLTDREWTGVWLSNMPLDCNEGAEGDTLLQVKLSESDIADFEWIEEGKGYREWLIPARMIPLQSIRIIDEAAEERTLKRFRRGTKTTA